MNGYTIFIRLKPGFSEVPLAMDINGTLRVTHFLISLTHAENAKGNGSPQGMVDLMESQLSKLGMWWDG